ncbi:MAG TPA: MerR family transcriptional regulator [Eubacteriaceae bacterium]|nr:MerR family transcriptional regulator [Eubacteriaceae bacterium]
MSEKKERFLVGELAKKMNVSVRTIQYYDQIGLLSPTEYTEGGRRLYTLKDCIVLHQIVRMKELGFSLKDIKERIMPAQTVEDIDYYLSEQEKNIETDIKILEKKRKVIQMFRSEMNKVNKVDWGVFVEILTLLRNDDEHFWIVKHFEKDVFEKIKEKYDEKKSKDFMDRMMKLCEAAYDLKVKNVDPTSRQAIELARKWWDEILNFTDGDAGMISQMVELSDEKEEIDSEYMKKFSKVEDYISEALTAYFTKCK